MEIVKEDNLENVSGGLTNHTAEYRLTGRELDIIKKCGYKVENKGNGAYYVLDEKGESINQKVLEGICTAAAINLPKIIAIPSTRTWDQYIPAWRNTDNSSVNLK